MNEKKILLSESNWLNDNIMDAAQALICDALGAEIHYQSVLNCQKQVKFPCKPVENELIQLMHDGANHWLLTFCSSGRIQVCDSLRTSLTRITIKSINSLLMPITMLPVQRQTDSHNCGLFAIGFAAELLNGLSPMDAKFDVAKMRSHIINCLERKILILFLN